MNKNNLMNQSLISGAFLVIGFLGFRIIKGQTIEVSDLIVAIVFGALVGIVSYFLGSQKK